MTNISTTTTSTPLSDLVISQTSHPKETKNLQSTSEKTNTLQEDNVVISKEAKEKNNTETDVIAKQDVTKKKLTPEEEAKLEKKQNESDMDEEIRELSMKILELTLKIEMLKAKEDKESVKERKSLETELAISKGRLEAKLKQKLDTAKLD
ncbi:hypothetical protein [Pseudoalteromonas denitrificans]|uniref:Uncharacterized protein n=1 Tax=Pseudoalteromonas denitrificans DSM 6059 TaxID=1123010 RepID=A0A1I1TYA8_9GAMM|nr:hypothetical protein [Pseudoalteromonas denitrificans]SFD63494.1 hypothetical protein SAMN02745724_05046 [Pseudoalteromonas denitrificans DSM 6059]